MKLKKLDIWTIFAPIIMLIVCVLTKTGWIQMIASVTGVIYLCLIAKENKLGYVFSFVNVIFYAILTWQQKLFGTTIFNVVYTLPVLVYGYIFWNKNQGKDQGKTKYLPNSTRIIGAIVLILVIAIYYVLATYVFKMNNALVDAIVVCFSFVGNLLMARKYVEQWIVWILLNVVNLAYWSIDATIDPESVAMVAMWIIYLLNNIFGFFSWKKNVKRN